MSRISTIILTVIHSLFALFHGRRGSARIVFIGRPVWDRIVHVEKASVSLDGLSVITPDRILGIPCVPDRDHADKLTARESDSLRPLIEAASQTVPGGGAVNSLLAAAGLSASWGAVYEFALISEASVDDCLERTLQKTGADSLSVGVNPMQNNYVFVERGARDRTIVRSPSEPVLLAPNWRTRVRKALEAKRTLAILINSCKSMELARLSVEIAVRGRVPLLAVLSTALPVEFRLRTLLPACAVAIFNLPEYCELSEAQNIDFTGDERTVDLDALAESLGGFALATRCASDLILTLGGRGLLFRDGKTGRTDQVRVSADIGARIAAILTRYGAVARNGSGDFFAGAFLMHWLQQTPGTPSRGLAAARQAVVMMARRFGVVDATCDDVQVRCLGGASLVLPRPRASSAAPARLSNAFSGGSSPSASPT